MTLRAAALFAVVLLGTPAFGQTLIQEDACASHKCRDLTKEERAAFGKVLERLMSLLPPSPGGRFEQNSMASVQGMGEFLISDETWEMDEFPANLIEPSAVGVTGGAFPRTMSLVWTWVLKDQKERELFHSDTDHATGPIAIYDLRVQATAFGVPAPPAVKPDVDGNWPTGFHVAEQSADARVEEFVSEDGRVLTSITTLGPRGGDTVFTDAPAAAASVRSLQVRIEGPAKDVRVLARKLDRRGLKSALTSNAPPPAPRGKKAKKK